MGPNSRRLHQESPKGIKRPQERSKRAPKGLQYVKNPPRTPWYPPQAPHCPIWFPDSVQNPLSVAFNQVTQFWLKRFDHKVGWAGVLTTKLVGQRIAMPSADTSLKVFFTIEPCEGNPRANRYKCRLCDYERVYDSVTRPASHCLGHDSAGKLCPKLKCPHMAKVPESSREQLRKALGWPGPQ